MQVEIKNIIDNFNKNNNVLWDFNTCKSKMYDGESTNIGRSKMKLKNVIATK